MEIKNEKKMDKNPVAELYLPNIGHVIAVSSGKGGVGKSTITTNLAAVLAKKGLKVGILDADIYGPSQTNLLGSQIDKDPVLGTEEGKIIPLQKHGIKFISMAALMGEEAPAVWRGPMAQRAVEQFLTLVEWGKLDFLLVDLPPGTGDIQLTLAQKSFLAGAIVVTTPQNIATKVAKRGLKMFQDLHVPILGVVENMSGYICPHCHHEAHIFKTHGGKNIASELKIPYLGEVPLDDKLVESSELGIPLVEYDSHSKVVTHFYNLADELLKQLRRVQEIEMKQMPKKIEFSENGGINFSWLNGKQFHLAAHFLRSACPCAQCVDETTGKKILDPNSIPLTIKVSDCNFVGRYGLSIHFSDHHRTGIYHFEHLAKWGEELAGENHNNFCV